MPKTYTVGRSAQADIRTPKKHDAVGKVHCEITDLGKGEVRVTDLESTNGTFIREHGRWVEIKGRRTLDADAEIMLGDYCTTPKELLAAAPQAEEPPPLPPKKPTTAPADTPVKRPKLRRNEFGEIVPE